MIKKEDKEMTFCRKKLRIDRSRNCLVSKSSYQIESKENILNYEILWKFFVDIFKKF